MRVVDQNRKILRIGLVEEFTGYKRPTIYKKMKEGTFPRQIPLGGRAVGWLFSELMAWQEERIALRDKEAIK